MLCSRAGTTCVPPLLCERHTAVISPSQELTVFKLRPGTLSCSTSCEKVENLFFRASSEKGRDDVNILDPSSMFSSVVSSVMPRFDNTTCSYSLNILWTNDMNIRNGLDSVLCVIVLDKDGYSCKTENVSLVFSGKFD